MTPLGTITEEATACRAAWAAKPRAKAGAHIHHEAPFEKLTEPIENRIAYILARKPKQEQALRLRLMRPVTAPAWAEYETVRVPALAEYNKVVAPARAEYDKVTASAWAEYDEVTVPARAAYEKVRAPAGAAYRKVTAPAHQRLCPTTDCPWSNGSIFGGTK